MMCLSIAEAEISIWERAVAPSAGSSCPSSTSTATEQAASTDCYQGNSRPHLLQQGSNSGSCCNRAVAHTPPSIHLEQAPCIQRRIRKRSSSRSSLVTADEKAPKKAPLSAMKAPPLTAMKAPLTAKKQPHELTRLSYPSAASSSSLLSAFPFTPLVTKTRSFHKLDSAAKVQRLSSSSSTSYTISCKKPPPPQQHQSSSSNGCYTRGSSSKHLRQLELDTFVRPSLPPPSRGEEGGKENHHAAVPPPTPSVLLGHTMRRNMKGETPLHMAAIKVSY